MAFVRKKWLLVRKKWLLVRKNEEQDISHWVSIREKGMVYNEANNK